MQSEREGGREGGREGRRESEEGERQRDRETRAYSIHEKQQMCQSSTDKCNICAPFFFQRVYHILTQFVKAPS